MNKYGAVKTAGYASKREALRAQALKTLERLGEISELREQVAFEIVPSAVVQGRKRAARKYVADFVYMQDGVQVVEDVKGVKTDIYTLKRQLMKVVHNIDILET